MHNIVVSDIWGKTPPLESLCKALGDDVDIVDPYAAQTMGFQAEEHAYAFFMANVGLKTYRDLVQSRLTETTSPVNLIGFSVGAAAIWQLSETLAAGRVRRAVCFYGSQIRHMPEIHPNVVVELVMPAHEPGFSIDALAARLAGKKNVVLRRTPYLHGFMNEMSKNYNRSGYAEYMDWMRQRFS